MLPNSCLVRVLHPILCRVKEVIRQSFQILLLQNYSNHICYHIPNQSKPQEPHTQVFHTSSVLTPTFLNIQKSQNQPILSIHSLTISFQVLNLYTVYLFPISTPNQSKSRQHKSDTHPLKTFCNGVDTRKVHLHSYNPLLDIVYILFERHNAISL